MRPQAAHTDRPARMSGILIESRSFLVRLSLGLLLTLLLIGQSSGLATAQATPEASTGGLDAAVAWLVSQQHESGGFIGFSGEPDAGLTIDAVLALTSVPSPDSTALEAATNFLREQGEAYAAFGPGQAAKLVLAIVALGLDPAGFGDFDPVALVNGPLTASIGFRGTGVFDHALAILALVAAGEDVPDGWEAALLDAQAENGGWAFDGSREPAQADSNTTAIVIQALIAAGASPDEDAIVRGLAYLRSLIAPETGGFGYQEDFPLVADANSTGIAIQALIAAGEDPASEAWGNPQGALSAFQNESGAFRYQDDFPDDNLYATVQAIPALAGAALPIRPS